MSFAEWGKRFTFAIKPPEMIHVRYKIGIFAWDSSEIMAAMTGMMFRCLGHRKIQNQLSLKTGIF